MSSNDGVVGVTLIWAIENFDSCLAKTGEGIRSPVFLTEALNDTEWVLGVYAKGYNDSSYISLELERWYDNETGKVIVDIELSIVSSDGSPLKWMELKNHGFVEGHNWLLRKFVERDDVFGSRKSEFLPQNTLTVRCRLWKRFNESTNAELLFARSRLHTERKCFIWKIKDFSSLQPLQRTTISIMKTSTQILFMTFELFFENDWKVQIEITQYGCPELLRSSHKISLLDGAGKTVKFAEDTFESMDDCLNASKQVWQFPRFIKKAELNKKKSLYLPMDVLSLRCECLFGFHDTDEQIENNQEIFLQNFHANETLPRPRKLNEESTENWRIAEIPSTSKFENLDAKVTDIGKHVPQTHNKFIHDMKSMYEEGLLSDFSLRAGAVTFRVHKNILSARSPVFRAMLTADMKERESDGIDIPDVDSDTLQRMLKFVYSDKVEQDMQWEAAMKLYFAADKYAMEDLKQISCSTLKAALSSSNACDILVHADLHEDQDLKSTTQNFIIDHDSEIIGTKEWIRFQKSHLHLTVEILSNLYMQKIKH